MSQIIFTNALSKCSQIISFSILRIAIVQPETVTLVKLLTLNRELYLSQLSFQATPKKTKINGTQVVHCYWDK